MNPEELAKYKVSIITKCIKESLHDVNFRLLIKDIFTGVTKRTILDNLWKYQSKFRFIPEARGLDYCKNAKEFINSGFGDCEDFVVFNATVLSIYGIPYKLRVMDTKNTGYYTHILLRVLNIRSGQWISFDGTYRIHGLGGEPKHTKIREFLII